MAEYSVVIKNGAVFEGTGKEPEITDIAIDGDEIVQIGNLSDDRAGIVIDAAGRYVTPGFIDLTTHSDTHWTLFFYPFQESFLRQGITTILGGNCGFSLAPFLGVEPLEEVGKWVDLSEINIDWQTMGEFLAELENHPLGVNFASLVGLNTIFHSASGQNKSAEEIVSAMEYLVREALEQGAYGVSMNLSLRDIQAIDINDLIHIAKIVAKKNGVVKHHLEDEGRELLPSVSKTLTIARESGARSHISHFRSLGKTSWPTFGSAIKMITRAKEENVDLTCDFSPYTNTDSELLFLLPSWARRKKQEELKNILSQKNNPEREQILDHLREITLHYDSTYVTSGKREYGVIGQSLQAVSLNLGLSPEETVIHLLLANNFSTRIFNEAIAINNLEKIVAEPFAVFATDGVGYDRQNYPVASDKSDLPHPESFGAFPYALGTIARDTGMLSWQETIRKMTSFPASILGLKDRGIIRKGMKADIVVLNPVTLSAEPNYADPFQDPQGIEQVIVNGVPVIADGKLTDVYPGTVLRKD